MSGLNRSDLQSTDIQSGTSTWWLRSQCKFESDFPWFYVGQIKINKSDLIKIHMVWNIP